MRNFTAAILASSLLGGCAAANRAEMEDIRSKQDSISRRLDLINSRLGELDSVRSDLHKIRLLTDYVGAKLAKQERASKDAPVEVRQLAIAPGESFAKGPENAPFTLVTFTDYECPFCRKLSGVLDTFAVGHSKELRWIAKNLPLDMHANARSAATAVISAGRQGKYFEYQSKLMSGTPDLSREGLLRRAKELNLDMARFAADMNDPRAWEPLLAYESNQAQELDVRGTPTVFLNGRLVRASSISDLENALNNLKRQKTSSQEGN